MKEGRVWHVISVVLLLLLVVASVLAGARHQAAKSAQARLDCARPWLAAAMELHDLHLKDPTTTSEASQLELMDQITKAYECVTGEKLAEMGH